MLFGWCDWSMSNSQGIASGNSHSSLDSKTVYTTKRFACDEYAPTLLEMTIYWIIEAFTKHPDVCSRPPPSRMLSDSICLQLAEWHEFTGLTGVNAKCKQVSHIAGWMPTATMDGQVVTSHPGMPHIVINAGGGMGMGMGMGMGGTGKQANGNTSTGFTNTNAATSTSTVTAHSHIPITTRAQLTQP